MKKKILIILLLNLFFIFPAKAEEVSVSYETHVQSIGWQDYVKNAEQAGTTGKALRIEAVKIRLTGDLADYYDIYYRVHVQSIGWQNYVKNDEIAGTTGKALRIEAIQIKLVQKKEISDSKVLYSKISYSSNVDNIWQDYVNDSELSGTTAQAKPIKGIKINLDTNENGNIEYQTYYAGKWNNYVKNNEVSGDLKNNIEAIKIRLTGDLVNKYDIYYRVHIQSFGWLDWTKNDIETGTIGYFYRLEGIEIRLLPKNSTEIKTGNNILKESKNTLSYSSHVQSIGWQSYVNSDEISGTTGQSKRVEAIKIKLDSANGNIEYKTYVQSKGFQNYVKNNEISGTTSQAKKLEAIQIKLTGNLANYYDVYYRTHISSIGWLDWAKNDEKSGSVGNETQIEAIQIKLVLKGEPAPGATSKKYVTGVWKNNKYYDYFNRVATGWKFIDGKKYFFNSDGDLKGSNVKKVIDVSSYQKNINWNTIKNDGDVDRAIIRVGWGMSYDDEPGIDSYFDRNIKEVQRLGIPYQIYIYAYAVTEAAANKEANFVKNMMSKYNIPKSTHVWYDAEEAGVRNVTTYSKTIPTFVNNLKNAGYTNVGVYGNLYALTSSYLNNSTIKSYPIWVAQYYKNCQYTGNYIGWQYTSTDFINGIEGNVDVSMFKN